MVDMFEEDFDSNDEFQKSKNSRSDSKTDFDKKYNAKGVFSILKI